MPPLHRLPQQYPVAVRVPTCAPGAAYSVLRVTTMFVRWKRSELLRDGLVVLATGDDGGPRVVSEKNFMSSRRRHTRSLSRPMTPLLATATMMEIRMARA